jgi:hypothetical protein
VNKRLLIGLLVLAALVLALGGWIVGSGSSQTQPRYV